MPPLDEVGEALRCVCLRWAAARSVEERHNIELKRKDKEAVGNDE